MPVDFKGLRVISFESRQPEEMARLIKTAGGSPCVIPALKQIDIDDVDTVLTFANKLIANKFDVLIVLTGKGLERFVKLASTKIPQKQLLIALQNTSLVARGPKSAGAMNALGLAPTIVVPAPFSYTELLRELKSQVNLEGKRFGIIDQGSSNPKLEAALRAAGALTNSVQVYCNAFPDDLAPLEEVVRGLASDLTSGNPENAAFALFTNASQVRHVFKLADQLNLTDQVKKAFKQICIGSVGPTCTEAIISKGLTVDYEPDNPSMASLVQEMARRGSDLLHKKHVAVSNGVDTNGWERIDMVWQPNPSQQPTIKDSVFMKACRREPVPYTPIWVMRQAGRYQREYMKVRSKVSMLGLCRSPELSAEVTLMAADRLGVDAAIIFADILLIIEPLGLKLEFMKGEGPVIHNPLRTRGDVDRLCKADINELEYVFEALRITRKALKPDIALIGFAGSPFTVASYMVEGGKSSHYVKTKAMMYGDSATWHALMERLTEVLVEYLNGQVAAGANALQLFDSWVGSLSPDDYREYILPHMKRLIGGLDKSAPVINFATGNPALLPLLKEAGGDVIGLDWRVDLAQAWNDLGENVAVMGNLDPIVLYAPIDRIRDKVKSILDKAKGRRGHIFNLGHGVLPDVPAEHVSALVDIVHELSSAR